jgi:hypothetical protein
MVVVGGIFFISKSIYALDTDKKGKQSACPCSSTMECMKNILFSVNKLCKKFGCK